MLGMWCVEVDWCLTVTWGGFIECRYNIEQEQRLAQETTVLVESYTVSGVPLLW